MFPVVRGIAAVVCASAVLVGCTVKANFTTDRTIDKAALEKGVTDQLTKKVGRSPDSVKCPGPLVVKKGETTRCVLTGDGIRYGVTVIITSVDGNNYHYSTKVDDQPLPG